MDQWLANEIISVIDTKPDFINLSMKLVSHNLEKEEISENVRAAFLAARDAGIGVIVAAGNDNEVFGDTPYTLSLARLAHEMNGYMRLVVATKYSSMLNNEEKSPSSNKAGIAEKYTLSAPGADIVACGAEKKRMTWSGTSFAAPMVTSAAALVKSYNPQLTAAQILDLLDRTARKTNLNGNEYLPSSIFGHGVINVHAALMRCEDEKQGEEEDAWFPFALDFSLCRFDY